MLNLKNTIRRAQTSVLLLSRTNSLPKLTKSRKSHMCRTEMLIIGHFKITNYRHLDVHLDFDWHTIFLKLCISHELVSGPHPSTVNSSQAIQSALSVSALQDVVILHKMRLSEREVSLDKCSCSILLYRDTWWAQDPLAHKKKQCSRQ